jgi:hypothetical protein
MGRTASNVKDRYNKKSYDPIHLRVKKGDKDKIKKHVKDFGYPSINGYIISLIKKDIGI